MKKITIFCGGSGCASLIKTLNMYKEFELSLIINAYDDGKSTGYLREKIYNFLGPSDFRKNFSYLIDTYDNSQLSLRNLIEYRFDKNEFKSISDLIQYIKNINFEQNKKFLCNLFINLDKNKIVKIIYLLKIIDHYSKKNEFNFQFEDMSFGNLIFAGYYLDYKFEFNQAIQQFSKFLNIKEKIFNISVNDNKYLIAKTFNNKLIYKENEIISLKSNEKIKDLYLVDFKILNTIKFNKKINFRIHNNPPNISSEAKKSILAADIIIYGPGTQYSSLFPSYMIAEKYIKKSKAKKILITNLDYDNDILGLKMRELIDLNLKYLNDKKNNSSIDEVYIDNYCTIKNSKNIHINNAKIYYDSFRNKINPNIHSGRKIYEYLLKQNNVEKNNILIFIDLINLRSFIQDFLDTFFETAWLKHFNKIKLIINIDKKSKFIFPHKSKISILFLDKKNYQNETDIIINWFNKKKGYASYDYLCLLCGDGMFRGFDIVDSFNHINKTDYGLLVGTRNQSRHQHFNSLKSVYGKYKFIYLLSKLSEPLIILLFYIRNNFILKDPLSGFKIFSRKNIKDIKINNLFSPSSIYSHLNKNEIEITEYPVGYFMKYGYSSMSKRINKSLKNILGLFI